VADELIQAPTIDDVDPCTSAARGGNVRVESVRTFGHHESTDPTARAQRLGDGIAPV
jgi:hypothetical protein